MELRPVIASERAVLERAPPRAAERPAPLPISGVVICQDEEPFIAACLRSLRRCAEIIVVDSGSTDRTVPIIEALRDEEGLPIVLLHQPWLGYASQKQFALSRATQPWRLSLDADEALDAALQDSLPRLIADGSEVGGWSLARLPTTVGGKRPPRAVYAKPILRLVRADAYFDERALVHEGLVVTGAVRRTRTGLIRHMRHLPFDEQCRKELRYARLKATERATAGRRPSLLRLLLNPPIYFLRLYLLHRWLLCGRAGFAHAVMGAIYSFSAEAMHFETHAEQGPSRS